MVALQTRGGKAVEAHDTKAYTGCQDKSKSPNATAVKFGLFAQDIFKRV